MQYNTHDVYYQWKGLMAEQCAHLKKSNCYQEKYKGQIISQFSKLIAIAHQTMKIVHIMIKYLQRRIFIAIFSVFLQETTGRSMIELCISLI